MHGTQTHTLLRGACASAPGARSVACFWIDPNQNKTKVPSQKAIFQLSKRVVFLISIPSTTWFRGHLGWIQTIDFVLNPQVKTMVRRAMAYMRKNCFEEVPAAPPLPSPRVWWRERLSAFRAHGGGPWLLPPVLSAACGRGRAPRSVPGRGGPQARHGARA